ncbi:MAG: MASE3 domain-containing protein [Methanosarcina sp.]
MYKNYEKMRIVESREIILWLAVIIILYLISVRNYLLFHSLAELFSIFVAYVVFLIVWKSRTRLENRTLIFIGIAYFFVASLDLLHTFAYKGMGVFSQYDTNLPTQLWIAARYMESISLLIAPLFLTNNYIKSLKNNFKSADKEFFFWRVFLVYGGITTVCIISIFQGNFPDSYIEGTGLTSFKITSEYMISLILICSLITLYSKKDQFEPHIFSLFVGSIIVTIFGELAFTFYTDVYGFSNLIGHFLKVLSFYLIYKAVIQTSFDDPFTLLFRELKKSEEAFRQETIFLKDDQGRIFNMLGIKRHKPESGFSGLEIQLKEEGTYPAVQNIHGLITFQVDEEFKPLFIEGAIEEITGYNKEDLLSNELKLKEIIEPEDYSLVLKAVEKSMLNPYSSGEVEYRIKAKNGETKWIRQTFQQSSEKSKIPKIEGFIRDITEHKKAEETLERIDKVRIKEIHHRIKNNLQVISSLLSLEAEKFCDEKMLEAFRESQNRVTSMAIIHEELYKGDDIDTLDFADYLQKLVPDLFNSYRVGNKNIKLNLKLEHVYLGMDTAIPLGIIVNELVSNALKHAFSEGQNGEILIILKENPEEGKKRVKDYKAVHESGCLNQDNLQFTLIIEDNGKGFPKDVDFRHPDSLGLELVNILTEQIDGCIELEETEKTRFIIRFNKLAEKLHN